MSMREMTTIGTVFRDYYAKAMGVIEETNWKESVIAKTDLGPMMYVIADFVAYDSGMDRVATSDSINSEWSRLIRNYESATDIASIFDERVDFFAQFIRGKKPSMDYWYSSNKPEPNPILNVTAAFCDLLYNPQRVKDYDYYSAVILPIDVTIDLTQNIFMPLYRVMVDYYNAVHTLE